MSKELILTPVFGAFVDKPFEGPEAKKVYNNVQNIDEVLEKFFRFCNDGEGYEDMGYRSLVSGDAIKVVQDHQIEYYMVLPMGFHKLNDYLQYAFLDDREKAAHRLFKSLRSPKKETPQTLFRLVLNKDGGILQNVEAKISQEWENKMKALFEVVPPTIGYEIELEGQIWKIARIIYSDQITLYLK
jgi:hypothetical protein